MGDKGATALAKALVYVNTDNTTATVVNSINDNTNSSNVMRGIVHIPTNLARMPQEIRFPLTKAHVRSPVR